MVSANQSKQLNINNQVAQVQNIQTIQHNSQTRVEQPAQLVVNQKQNQPALVPQPQPQPQQNQQQVQQVRSVTNLPPQPQIVSNVNLIQNGNNSQKNGAVINEVSRGSQVLPNGSQNRIITQTKLESTTSIPSQQKIIVQQQVPSKTQIVSSQTQLQSSQQQQQVQQVEQVQQQQQVQQIQQQV